MRKVLLLLALLPSVALAQQPAPQQSVVQQLMANDANIKAALASELDKANAKIAEQTKEIEELKKKVPAAPASEPKKP